MITVGINGSFIRKPASGMGQVSWHFVRQLTEDISKGDYPDKKFIVYLEEKLPNNFIQNKIPARIKFKVVKQRFYKRDDLVRKIFWEKYWLPAQVKKDGCNIFFSPYQSATVLSGDIKHIMFVHDVIPNIFPEYLNNSRKRFYYWLVGQAVQRVERILTNSNFSKKEISRVYKISQNKIKVVYLACDPIFKQQLSPEEIKNSLKKYGIKSNDKFILYEGGTDFRKNIGRIIEAYGMLVNELKSRSSKKILKLVIIGKFHKHLVPLVLDVEEKIAEVVEKYDIDEKLFRAVGFVEQEDLPAFFQSAEVFIYPSLYEGFGIPVLEAMTSNTPVVTSKTTSIPEVISAEAGYLINDPTDVEEIKNKLKDVLEDTEENRQTKISLAQQEAQKFSWEKFTKAVMKNLVSI